MLHSTYDMNQFWNLYGGFFRECRGVVIDIINNSLLLTPFKKFMNLNECEENSLENINEEIRNAKYVEVSNKLDGTMISARWTNFLDEFPVMVATQKNTDEDISYQISEAKRMLYDNYIKKIGK